MIPTTGLHHAVLYVHDAKVAGDFYQAAFDFEIVEDYGASAVFLRSRHGTNHHDLGLIGVGPDAAPLPPHRVGLYHLAWEVPTIESLAEARTHLIELRSLVGESDHGVSKSLYAKDPDGNEFEVVWNVPSEDWGEYAEHSITEPLHLQAELARFGSRTSR